MQAQLTDLLGLHRTSSRVSIDSITSFAGSVNTKKAYKKFYKSLFQTGVTAEMIKQKEAEILDIFKAQNAAIGGLKDDNTIRNLTVVSTLLWCRVLSIFVDRNILTVK